MTQPDFIDRRLDRWTRSNAGRLVKNGVMLRDPDEPIPLGVVDWMMAETAADRSRTIACWPWSHRWSKWEPLPVALQSRRCQKCGLTKERLR